MQLLNPKGEQAMPYPSNEYTPDPESNHPAVDKSLWFITHYSFIIRDSTRMIYGIGCYDAGRQTGKSGFYGMMTVYLN